MKSRVLLDERARLVAVESRHHDVDEHEIGLMVGDLRQRVEAILRQDHRAPRLQQKNFGAAANRVRVVDHQHLDALQRVAFRHFAPRHASVTCFGAERRAGTPRSLPRNRGFA